jgi:uncharacterized small protein (DUF1192 family)
MEDRLRSIVARFRALIPARRRLALTGGFLVGGILLLLIASNKPAGPTYPPIPFVSERGGQSGRTLPPAGVGSMGSGPREVDALKSSHLQAELYRSGPVDSAGGAFPEPRIAYSAELSVVTKEFAHSRSSLEEILERHRGYVAKLRMVGQPSGSVLSAVLRVPSSEYRSALTELKAVGFVEHEEEAADEITQQHGELEARLINAQNEEQRIQRLLHDRAEKVYDYGSLERQVALLRTEIERIESQRLASGSRVSFANVSFSLREERTPVAETIGAKLRSTAANGLSDAFESISVILLFLAARGPLLALWAAIIYFPVRFFWRRRSQWAFREAEAPKNS